MTDYEMGMLVGALIAWPVVSIGTALVMGIFVAGGRKK